MSIPIFWYRHLSTLNKWQKDKTTCPLKWTAMSRERGTLHPWLCRAVTLRQVTAFLLRNTLLFGYHFTYYQKWACQAVPDSGEPPPVIPWSDRKSIAAHLSVMLFWLPQKQPDFCCQVVLDKPVLLINRCEVTFLLSKILLSSSTWQDCWNSVKK